MSVSVGCCWDLKPANLGRGGVGAVAVAAGVSRSTVTGAFAELDRPSDLPEGRSRRAGGGRKRAAEKDPGLPAALEALVDPQTRGDPESPLRWTCKSDRQLATMLTGQGHPVSERTVARLLHEAGLQLAGQRQDHRGQSAPGSQRAVRAHQREVRRYMRAGDPVISRGHQEEGTRRRPCQERRP